MPQHQQPMAPHRGTMILVFGILGFVRVHHLRHSGLGDGQQRSARDAGRPNGSCRRGPNQSGQDLRDDCHHPDHRRHRDLASDRVCLRRRRGNERHVSRSDVSSYLERAERAGRWCRTGPGSLRLRVLGRPGRFGHSGWTGCHLGGCAGPLCLFRRVHRPALSDLWKHAHAVQDLAGGRWQEAIAWNPLAFGRAGWVGDPASCASRGLTSPRPVHHVLGSGPIVRYRDSSLPHWC